MYKIKLSPFQKTFFNEWQINPHRSDYNIVSDQFLYGELCVDKLRIAIKKFVNEHLLFNSMIEVYEEEPFWVKSNYAGKLEFLENQISNAYICKYITKPFDLYSGELYRFLLIKYTTNEYRFIASCHHILVSGFTAENGVFTNLINYYKDNEFQIKYSQNDQVSLLSSLGKTLSELINDNLEQSKKFWQHKLNNLEALDLKFLFLGVNKTINNIASKSRVKETRFDFNQEILIQTTSVGRKYRITPYLFGQMVFAYLLHRYTGQNKFGISYPVSIKGCSELVYGVQINTSIMPYNFEHILYFDDIVNQIKEFIYEIKSNRAFDYRYCPISEIMNADNKGLLDVAFIQTNLKDIPFNFPHIESVKINNNFNIDLTNKVLFEQEVKDQRIIFRIRYNSTEVDDKLLSGFINCYHRLYKEILRDEYSNSNRKCMTNYSLLDATDYRKIIYEWNDTFQPYPKDKVIHQLFEEQVAKTPNNIAVVYEGKQLTYQELNSRSNQLAHYIRNTYYVKPDDLIAIYLDKSEYLLIALLGVLKSGAAYVPIDISYPNKRVKCILNDIRSKVVITISACHLNIKSIILSLGNSCVIDSFALDKKKMLEALLNESIINPEYINKSNDLANVIYTSGTTGTPKGVMVEHRNLGGSISGFIIDPLSNMSSRTLLSITNPVFDIFALEFMLPLFNGDSLHLFDISKSKSKIKLYNYDCIQVTPSTLGLLIDKIDYVACGTDTAHLIKVLIGGELVTISAINQLNNLQKKLINHGINVNFEIINVYGPTEATIWSIAGHCSSLPLYINKLGRPLKNECVYILDACLNPLPIGGIGEIYIGGCGVARGYLHDDILTNSKFISNPFFINSDKDYAKLYKTGDLGRWHPDGYIEFIGRKDFQVKLHGHRIELTEIETVLNNYSGIHQSVVRLEKEKQYLIGYYTADKKLLDENIKNHLSKFLPDFMCPNKFIYLAEFPLTSNGKIDRNKLYKFDLNLLTDNNYIVPRNKLENVVCQVFADILGLQTNQIGIHDDFFKLGGTSLLAIRVANKLQNKYNINVEVSMLIKYRTIYQLSTNIGKAQRLQNGPTAFYSNKCKDFKLSFAQERLWFIAKYQSGNKAYNVPLIFKVNQSCNIHVLVKSLKAVMKRHEVLRTKIKEDKVGEGYPSITLDDIEIKIQKINTRKRLDYCLRDDIGHIFNLTQELPIRICCYDCKKEFYLSIVVHHIAFDGWSGDILVRDLVKYYEYHQNMSKFDNELDLPDVEIQYKEFAIWQRNYLKDKVIEDQLIYWKHKLEGYESLNLPIDKSRPAIFDYVGKTIEFKLPMKLSIELRKCAKELNISLYSLLLSGFYLLLRAYSSQNDIIIGTMVSNRHYKNVSNLVGFFVNALVLRQQINSEVKVTDFINTVFNEVLEAQLNQDVPFDKIAERFGYNKDLSRHPIFQVVFGMHHFGVGSQSLLTEYKKIDMYQTAKFDLSIIFDDSCEQLNGKLEYATSIFELDTIKSYLKTYLIILKQFSKISGADYKDKQIKDIHYINKADYKKLIIDYNNTYQEYPHEKTIHQLFEEQVEKTPDNIAIICEDRKLTYKELNQRSNQLAHYIKDKYKICPDDLIALYLYKNEYMIIAMLAVLKAGAAYVPISPDYPQERVTYILEDTYSKAIFTNEKYKEKLSEIINNTIACEMEILDTKESIEILDFYLSDNLDNVINVSNLAYVIYTSGTTGKPKGVMLEHCGVVNLAITLNNTFKLQKMSKNYLAYSNYVFDAHVLEIYTALLNGHVAYIINDSIRHDLQALRKYIKNNNITIALIPPTLLTTDIILSLDTLIVGGEVADKVILDKYINNGVKVINAYGPTESTVCATINYYDSVDDVTVIGRPLANIFSYILDINLNPLPIGAIGELYISGVSIARGYLHKPELTNKKFILSSFQNKKLLSKSNRLYKTGDFARLLPDGRLKYMGRKDFQVKIRGHRVEFGEIESVLNCYDNIKQSIVTLEQGDNYKIGCRNKLLVAYYVKKIEASNTGSSNIVNDWKKIYDLTYAQLENGNLRNNFIGWNSSYTGEVILEEQLCEWRDEIISKIHKLPAKRIVEIGCGSGLLLFDLIENCEYYYAFDFSKSAMKYIQDSIDDLGFSYKFQSFVVNADKVLFRNLLGKYDTVILNSVIQYFPSLEYLEDVLTKAIENINTYSQIFIGDVRDFRLLECFAYSVLNFKHGTVNISDIEYFKIKEKELLIVPEYFLYLQKSHSYISHVEFLPKLGNAINEMNCYRYDVILHINKNKEQFVDRVSSKEFKKIINLADFLQNNREEILYIKYPNVRIAKEYIECKNLYNNECDLTVNEIVGLLDLKQLAKVFENSEYKIKLYLDVGNPLYFNVIAYRNTAPEIFFINYQEISIIRENFANNPLHNIQLFDSQYTEGLRRHLESKLPDYMVPQYLIPINNIPRNSNGKLDYNALPKPEFNISNNYVSPKTKLEKILCKIFSQILNMAEDKIGIQDNFFKIGGNSILAIRLIAKINKQLNYNVKVVDIFTKNTVYSLANYLLFTKNQFNFISNLNHVYHQLNMFMIHPAFAGSETYVGLADKLSNIYSCYGIDNYNLHHYKKIKDIKYLANFYLDSIDEIRKQTNQENQPYLLLGWSLGGQIALNIAYILEQKGYNNIYVILIDSVYPDKNFSHYLSKVALEQTRLKYFAQQAGFDLKYVTKVKNNFKYDIQLSFQETQVKLKCTRILLFKAMKKEAILFLQNYDSLKEYVLALQYNNINKVTNIKNICLIKLKDSDHFNLLEQDKLIYHNIVSFMNK